MPRMLVVQRVGPAHAIEATWTRVIKTQTTIYVGAPCTAVNMTCILSRKWNMFCSRWNEMSAWQEKKKRGKYAGSLMRLAVKYSCN